MNGSSIFQARSTARRFRTYRVQIIRDAKKQIASGSEWFKEIQSALTNSKIAALLVSPDFLASDFIHEHELAPLLKQAEQGGAKILLLCTSP
jgi:hypothetical protein